MKIPKRLLLIPFFALCFLIYLFLGRFVAESNPDSKANLKYVTGNRVILQDCVPVKPCGFTVDKKSSSESYKSIEILNPATQNFQHRFYVTDSWTWEHGGGIAYVSGDDYVTVQPVSDGGPQKTDYRVENITATNLSQFRSWWWYSAMFDALILFGVPLGFIVLMAVLIVGVNGAFNLAEDTAGFLDSKDGRRWLKRVDKHIRKKR